MSIHRDYLHGYETTEQERLCTQADFLRNTVHAKLKAAPGERNLEIGCGVGAQLRILAEENAASFVGLDRSYEQLAAAQTVLSENIARGQVELVQGEAESLPFQESTFDQIFIFFVLEHVSDPLAILREAKRVLKKNGRLTVTEVHNPSLFVYPQSAALDAYWTAYNRLQVDLGGDPCIGPKLPNLGLRAGMQVARYGYIGPILDARAGTSQRAESVKFWIDLFCSARSRLEGEDRVTSDQVEETLAHLSSLEHNPESILHYTGCQIELKY